MNPTRLTALLCACALALGCQSGEPDEPNSGESAQVEAPDPSVVVAEIDGEPVTEVELDAQLQAMATRGEHADREAALEELIDLRLLELQAEAEEIHRQPDTAAEIRRQRAMLLANHLIRTEIDTLKVGDEQLREQYDEYVADAVARREYNARHILVDTRDEAAALIEKLDGQDDFAELAREHSTGPSSDRGGDLDWFRSDEVVEPFAEAVTTLTPGEYTPEPVQSRFGWHVILLEDARDSEPRSFDDMRDELRERRINNHIESYLRTLRERSDIAIH